MAGYEYAGEDRKRDREPPECGTMRAVGRHRREGLKASEMDMQCRLALAEYQAHWARENRPKRSELPEAAKQRARAKARKYYADNPAAAQRHRQRTLANYHASKNRG